MYVLTWPLPSQCPYQDHLFYEVNQSQNVDSETLEMDFGNLSGKFSKKHTPIIARYSIIGSDEEHDDIFEQRVEILRQIPPQVKIFGIILVI